MANEKIAENVVGGYKKIEEGVVGGYKKIEEGAVGGFNKIADKFVENFLTKEGETGSRTERQVLKNEKEHVCCNDLRDNRGNLNCIGYVKTKLK